MTTTIDIRLYHYRGAYSEHTGRPTDEGAVLLVIPRQKPQRVSFEVRYGYSPHLDHDTCRSLAMMLLRETGAVAEVEEDAEALEYRSCQSGCQYDRGFAAGLREALAMLEGKG